MSRYFTLLLILLLAGEFAKSCPSCAGRMDEYSGTSFVPRDKNGRPIYYKNSSSSSKPKTKDEKKDPKDLSQAPEKEKEATGAPF